MYSPDVAVAFVNHALEFADVVGMIVRRHIGRRQVPRGRLLERMPLERDAITDMRAASGGAIRSLGCGGLCSIEHEAACSIR